MNAFSAGKRYVLCAVSKIYNVIRTADSFPYTAKFMFFGVRKNRTQKIRR